MKKIVLRILAVMMVAAIMVPSMSNVSVALAAEEAVTLDLSKRGPVTNGDEPADNADGSITFSGGKSMKCTFPLPETLATGESIKVNVKLQFNSDADTGVRFYLVNGVDANIATEIATIANEGTGTVIEKTITLTAAADANELLFASSGYGVYIDNITVFDITLGDKPAEAPVASNLVALDINEQVFVSGDAPADNADGSITFSGGKSMKCSFALPETLAAGESITVNVKLQFDSADDLGVRFYLIANGVDSNIATEIQAIANEGTGIVEKTIKLTAAADSTELLFASSSYGVYINNVTIHEITLGDKPAETPVANTPVVEISGNEYVVKSGDTLGAIARACGLTVKDLAEANNIENPDLIAKGTKLTIPTVDTTKRHIVVSGDTLGAIAKKYGYTLAELVEANNIENADFIKVDQLIVLP